MTLLQALMIELNLILIGALVYVAFKGKQSIKEDKEESYNSLYLYLGDKEIKKLYDALNKAVSSGDDYLKYYVDDMNKETFPQVFRSLKNNKLDFDLMAENRNGTKNEFFIFRLSNYPNKRITPIWKNSFFQSKLPDLKISNGNETFKMKNDNVMSLKRKKVNKEENNVIYVNFRK